MTEFEKWELKHKLLGDLDNYEILKDDYGNIGLTDIFIEDNDTVSEICDIPPVDYINLDDTLGFTRTRQDDNFILRIPNTVKVIENTLEPFVGIKSVSLPDSLIQADFAFYKFNNLEFVELPDGFEKRISGETFKGTKFREKIGKEPWIVNNTLIDAGKYSHIMCNKPIDNSILLGLKEIRPYSMKYCKFAGRKLVIPDTIEKIGYGAFKSCNIESVEIPGSVKVIDCGSFGHCSNLSNIQISNGVEYIMSDAFCETAVESVEIPESVQWMSIYALSDCKNLDRIYISSKTKLFDDFGASCNDYRVHNIDSDIEESIQHDALGLQELLRSMDMETKVFVY